MLVFRIVHVPQRGGGFCAPLEPKCRAARSTYAPFVEAVFRRRASRVVASIPSGFAGIPGIRPTLDQEPTAGG